MFDEDKAIEFIRSVTGDMLAAYDDDQILNIIDIIFDWQEDNGFLDIDADDADDEIDIDVLTNHVAKLLHKDKGNLVADSHIRPIVEAELRYEETLDPFED